MALNPAEVATINAYAGDTFSQTFRLTNNGTPIDLDTAGWSNWSAQYRVSAFSPDALDFTVDASDAGNGNITMVLTATQTEDLVGSGVFDLQAEQGDSVRTWLKGSIQWTRGVTRG